MATKSLLLGRYSREVIAASVAIPVKDHFVSVSQAGVRFISKEKKDLLKMEIYTITDILVL